MTTKLSPGDEVTLKIGPGEPRLWKARVVSSLSSMYKLQGARGGSAYLKLEGEAVHLMKGDARVHVPVYEMTVTTLREIAEKTVRAAQRLKKRPARVPGGLAARRHPSEFPFEKLVRGTLVELEHTNDPRVAMEIAMDHLTEDINYYEKLSTIEKHSNHRRLMR